MDISDDIDTLSLFTIDTGAKAKRAPSKFLEEVPQTAYDLCKLLSRLRKTKNVCNLKPNPACDISVKIVAISTILLPVKASKFSKFYTTTI